MKDSELETYLEEQFDDEYAQILKDSIKKEALEEIKNKFNVRKRITLTHTGNKIGGLSTKILNIFQIKQTDLIASLSSVGLLFFVDKTVAFLFTLLNLTMNTIKHLTITLSEREAQVLFVIYNLKEALTLDRIHSKYLQIFGELDKLQIVRSIKVLEELKILERKEQFEYQLIEKISIKNK